MKITICGSRKFENTILKTYNRLTKHGYLVYLPYMEDIKQYDGETNNERVTELIDTLHKTHEEKILESDVVLVVDTDCENMVHVGDDTRREINFAIDNNIDVLFISSKMTMKMLLDI